MRPLVRLIARVAALSLLARHAIEAQGGSRLVFTLRSASQLTLGTGPTTILVGIANTADAAATIRPTIELPPRWRVLAGTEPITVARHAREIWLLSFVAPSAPAAGRYVIRLGATAGEQRVYRDSVIVTVGRRIAARVRAPTSEQYAPTDSEVTLRYVVRNAGNSPATFHAQAKSALAGMLRTNRTRLELGVGDSAIVDVAVGAPPRIDKATIRRVTHEISADDASVDSAQATALFVPPVVDNTTRRLPMRLTVRTAGRMNDQVSPVLFTSRGAIDEAGQWTIDADVRGPGPKYSPFGERDHYLLDLRGPSTHLQVGDITPEQSRLTEPRWQQFGAAAQTRIDGVTIGAFGARDRFFYSRGGSGGATVGVPIGLGTMSFNGVYYAGATTRTGGIGTVSTKLALPAAFAVDAEAGTSVGGSNTTRPTAGVAHVTQRGRHTWLDAQLLRADTSFPGPLHGAEMSYLSGGAQLFAGISGHASMQDYTQFRPHLPVYDSLAYPNGAPSPKQRTFERSAGLSISRFGSIDAVRRENERGDRDELLRITTVGRVGHLSLVATGEDGKRYSDGAVAPTWRAGLSTAWSTSPFNVNLFGNYTNGAPRRAGVVDGRDKQLSAGASATLRVGDSWRAALFAIANGAVATGVAWDSTSLYLVDAAIVRELPGSHSIGVHVRSQRSSVRWFADQTLVLLEYGLPLSLRLPFTSGSRVTGRVVDQVTGDPVPNALVRLGEVAAITDRAGRVEFPSMRSGRYPLAVIAGNGVSPGVRAPAALDIDGSHSASFHVDVYPPTRTRVNVRRWVRAETPIGSRPVDSLVVSDEPPPTVTVTLVSGADTLRREVIGGTLDVGSELYPGIWVAQIDASELPSGFELRVPATTFVVSPRTDAVVTIDLIATQRIPRSLPGGEIKVVPPPPKKADAPTSPVPTPKPKRSAPKPRR